MHEFVEIQDKNKLISKEYDFKISICNENNLGSIMTIAK